MLTRSPPRSPSITRKLAIKRGVVSQTCKVPQRTSRSSSRLVKWRTQSEDRKHHRRSSSPPTRDTPTIESCLTIPITMSEMPRIFSIVAKVFVSTSRDRSQLTPPIAGARTSSGVAASRHKPPSSSCRDTIWVGAINISRRVASPEPVPLQTRLMSARWTTSSTVESNTRCKRGLATPLFRAE